MIDAMMGGYGRAADFAAKNMATAKRMASAKNAKRAAIGMTSAAAVYGAGDYAWHRRQRRSSGVDGLNSQNNY